MGEPNSQRLQRRPRRLHSPRPLIFQPHPDRRHSRQLILKLTDAAKQLLISNRILHHNRRLSIHRQHQRSLRLPNPRYMRLRVPLKIRNRPNLFQINHGPSNALSDDKQRIPC
jgi:hypothetical protein